MDRKLAVEECLAIAVEILGDRAEAVLARVPLIDPRVPRCSDLDLLAIGDCDDFFPERLVENRDQELSRRVDLIWIPRLHLDDLTGLGAFGLVGHRLLGSDVIRDRTGYVTDQLGALRLLFYDPPIQTRRIAGFLEMGFLTVQEIGVTWDFPALALFWLHMASAACLAAILDGAGVYCPNVYTRPFDYVELAEHETGRAIRDPLIQALHLDAGISPSVLNLRYIFDVVSHRFPEPQWPKVMRELTRYEYRYFSLPTELEWRIGVAKELSERGFDADALFYLRFWGYALARLPMVHQRAQEGIDVSFVRPSRAVQGDLEQLCPDILEPLSQVLGGDGPITRADLTSGLDFVLELREYTLEFLAKTGLLFPDLKEWRPYQKRSTTENPNE